MPHTSIVSAPIDALVGPPETVFGRPLADMSLQVALDHRSKVLAEDRIISSAATQQVEVAE